MSELHVVYGLGPVGRAVIDELLAREKQVRVISRRDNAEVPAGVQVVRGDATDAQNAREVCQDATHVYNCTNAKDFHRWPQQFPALQAGVLAGATAHDAKYIAIETLYPYGPHDGVPMTEEMPLRGTGTRAATRVQMTRELWAAHEAGMVRVVVGRASDFFGPRVNLSAVGERLFAPLLQGKTAYVLGDPDMMHSYTYMTDVGKALVILGEHDEALGQPWHIPNPRTVTTREFVQMACDAAGVVPKLQGTPRWFANVLSIFMAPMRGIGENYYMFTEPYIVDASKFTNAFGDIATPLEQALEATVRWYKNHLGL